MGNYLSGEGLELLFSAFRFGDYLLSRPPPDGLPVVLGHPPLPFDMCVRVCGYTG